MKKLTYIIIAAVVFSILTIVSCSDEFKSNDKEAPSILSIRFNVDDTLMFAKEVEVDGTKKVEWVSIALNDFKTGVDTLVIGHPVTFRAHFTDGDGGGLSSAVVRIWGDTLMAQNEKDTCFRLRVVPNLGMYGLLEYKSSINVALAEKLPEKIDSKNPNRPSDEKLLKVRPSTGEYYFSVRCSDLAGNQDSISYVKDKVVIMTRLQILEMRGLVDPAEPEPESEIFF